MLPWLILPIFNRSSVIRTFHFGWDFPTASQICGVFGENDPQSQNFKKHLHRRHFLTSNRVFWAIVRGNRFTGLCCAWAWLGNKKNKQQIIKIKIKSTRPRYFTTTLGCHRPRYFTTTWGATADMILTKLDKVGEPRDVITLAKFQVGRLIFVSSVRGWSLTILALHWPLPSTRQSPAGLSVIVRHNSEWNEIAAVLRASTSQFCVTQLNYVFYLQFSAPLTRALPFTRWMRCQITRDTMQ